MIYLQSGNYYHFETPHQTKVELEDIAHALSNICRFGGHTRTFYSVSEHSIHVSHLVPKHLALYGLLHDAHEAYVGDMPTPLKNLCFDYRGVEARAESHVWEAFGLKSLQWDDLQALSKADLQMLRHEKENALHCRDEWAIVEGVEKVDVQLEFWNPQRAKAEFIKRYMELTK